MGRLNINIPDELERKFRVKAVESFGGKKGSLSMALEEAIKHWIEILLDITEKAGFSKEFYQAFNEYSNNASYKITVINKYKFNEYPFI